MLITQDQGWKSLVPPPSGPVTIGAWYVHTGQREAHLDGRPYSHQMVRSTPLVLGRSAYWRLVSLIAAWYSENQDR